MFRSRLFTLVMIILFSLLVVSGVLAASSVENDAEPQSTPAPFVDPYEQLIQPNAPQGQEDSARSSNIITPTIAYPPGSQVSSINFSITQFELHNCDTLYNPVANCSFETGDFTGWIVDDFTTPYFAISIQPAGFTTGYGLFLTQPTQGAMVLVNGFDAAGPDQASLAQDIDLPPDSGYLRFDYRLGWDLLNYGAATLAREFWVEVQPSGGGAVLQKTTVFVAQPDTVNLDTGNLTGRVDVSKFAGKAVRIKLVWYS